MTREEICDEILCMLLRLKKRWPDEEDENWAEHWVEKMRPKARWSWEEVKAVQKSVGDEHNTTLLWAAMNAVWSDMGKELESMGIRDAAPVLRLARAFWLEDEDAVEMKMKRYYEEIVKH